MKGQKVSPRIMTLVLFLLLVGLPATLAAAESAAAWRPTYDLVLRWFNFLLLVFLLFRYGRAPIKAFIRKKRTEVSQAISELEEKKASLLKDCEAAKQLLAASKDRLTEVHERIVRRGEKHKADLIAAAKRESEFLIESAQRRIAGQVLQARKQIQAEIIDEAVAIAFERLPEIVEPQDLLRQEKRFLDAVSGMEQPPPPR
jgi:F-type H+-transporting ATPase subunit b